MTEQLKLGGLEMPNGSAPIVLVGANGSGKSSVLGALKDRACFLPPHRHLSLADQIGNSRIEKAKSTLVQRTAQFEQGRGAEFRSTLEVLVADYQARASNHLQSVESGGTPPIPETALRRVQAAWAALFPGRRLEVGFADGRLHVASASSSGEVVYSGTGLSSGERVALYILARVFLAERSWVVVDEPCLHLHPVLARRLWDAVEDALTDKRLIYATHDLSFALSRRGASYFRATSRRVLEPLASLPSGLFEEVVGAASLSTTATRFLFVEDLAQESLMEAWLGSESGIAIVRSGDCDRVEAAVQFMNSSRSPVTNAQAVGLIDRDDLTDDAVEARVARGVHVLKFRNVEGALCSKGVFEALSKRLGAEADHERLISAYMGGVSNELKVKSALKRVKFQVEDRIKRIMNRVESKGDASRTKEALRLALGLQVSAPAAEVDAEQPEAERSGTEAPPPLSAVFETIYSKAETAFDEGFKEFEALLRVWDGKPILGALASGLSLKGGHETYRKGVEAALRDGDEEMRAALVGRLPSAAELWLD